MSCYKVLSNYIIESILIKELELKRFDLENVSIVLSLVRFYGCVDHLEFKEEVKKQAMRGIRYHEFDLKMNR